MKILSLFCLLAAFASEPARAYNDGGLDYPAPESSHSTVKKKHLHVERDADTSSSNRHDLNFIGVQGSLGLANQTTSGDVTIDSSNRLGMMWSAYYERRFIPYLGARLEGGYNQRGFSSKDAERGGTDNFNLNFMEFALQLKAQVPTSIVTPFVAVGPFMGFALSKSETNSPDNGGNSAQISTLDTTINGFNFGLNFGGGIDFQAARHINLEIGARYSMGLVNVFTNQAQQTAAAAVGSDTPNAAVHLNDLQFLAGASYSL